MNRNWATRAVALATIVVTTAMSGCGYIEYKHRKPHITAFPASPANRCEAPGIPFYLPKPLLVVSKNFYHVEDAKIGLTGSAPIPTGFASQAEYAKVDLNGSFSRSGTSSMQSNDAKASEDGDGQQVAGVAHSPTLHSNKIPSGPLSTELVNDGLGPHMFFTYEIVFVPDLTQKYTLEINGGPGEIRAAMNLVNGWQFTGLGPYYMKDSSTAQNIMAQGVSLNLGLGGASDVINSVANLKSLAGGGASVSSSDVAAIAEAMDNAQKEQVFDASAFPMDQWSTKTISYDDGSQEIIKVPPKIERYAEISVYEASVEGDRMVWSPIAEKQYDREFLGIMSKKIVPMQVEPSSLDRRPAGNGGNGGLPLPPPQPEGKDANASEASTAGASSVRVQPTSRSFQFADRMLSNSISQLTPLGRSAGAAGAAGFDSPPVATQDTSAARPETSAMPFTDPELTKVLLQQALAPPAPPMKTVWERLHPRHVIASSTVNGTVAQ